MKHEKQKILAAFDLETSGLDPAVHDIIEIAIVPLNPDFKRSELPEFTARIKAVHPENADPESLKISGLNPFEGEDIQKVATDITKWMSDNHIERIEAVGHNLRFDLDFFQIIFLRIFMSRRIQFPQDTNIFADLFYRNAQQFFHIRADVICLICFCIQHQENVIYIH